MNNIVLARVDSRQLHGQVVTKWIPQFDIERVIIINNELVKDEFMKMVYQNATPKGVILNIMSEEQAKTFIVENEENKVKTMLLFPKISTAVSLSKMGINIESLQIGGLGGAPNRKAVFGNITLDDYDVGHLKNLKNSGTRIYFQIIPEDKPQDLDLILKKY